MNPIVRSASFTAADLVVTDAIITATATDTVAVAFTDGDCVTAVLSPSRGVTITRSLATAAYTTDAITITTKAGTIETATPADADGGDVLRFSSLIDNIARIDLPAQASTGGSYQIGVDDIGAPRGERMVAVELYADSPLLVQYGEPLGQTDVIPYVSARPIRDITPTRVVTNLAATSTTTTALTIYY